MLEGLEGEEAVGGSKKARQSVEGVVELEGDVAGGECGPCFDAAA